MRRVRQTGTQRRAVAALFPAMFPNLSGSWRTVRQTVAADRPAECPAKSERRTVTRPAHGRPSGTVAGNLTETLRKAAHGQGKGAAVVFQPFKTLQNADILGASPNKNFRSNPCIYWRLCVFPKNFVGVAPKRGYTVGVFGKIGRHETHFEESQARQGERGRIVRRTVARVTRPAARSERHGRPSGNAARYYPAKCKAIGAGRCAGFWHTLFSPKFATVAHLQQAGGAPSRTRKRTRRTQQIKLFKKSFRKVCGRFTPCLLGFSNYF